MIEISDLENKIGQLPLLSPSPALREKCLSLPKELVCRESDEISAILPQKNKFFFSERFWTIAATILLVITSAGYYENMRLKNIFDSPAPAESHKLPDSVPGEDSAFTKSVFSGKKVVKSSPEKWFSSQKHRVDLLNRQFFQ